MTEIDWEAYARVYDHFASFDYAAPAYDFYHWLVDRLDEREYEPAVFLEIGCGTGIFVEKLVEWYPKSSFLLVDSSAPMLSIAQKRIAGAPVEFHQTGGDEFLATLQPESVDVAVFCRSWFGLRARASAAANLSRALRHGGMVFLLDMTSPYDIAQYEEEFGRNEPERWPVFRAAMEAFNAAHAEGRYRIFSESELAELFGDAGLEPVAFESLEPGFNFYRACFAKP